MVACGVDRVQSMPEDMLAKYVMSYSGIEIYINKVAVNNQQGTQSMLQVVQKTSYFLEGT